MRDLYTVCYPELSAPDRSFIESFRRRHDRPRSGLIAVHFTLVFAASDVAPERYVDHVRAVAASTAATSRDRTAAGRLCDLLNRSGLSIAGRLSTITVGAIEGGRFVHLHEATLDAEATGRAGAPRRRG